MAKTKKTKKKAKKIKVKQKKEPKLYLGNGGTRVEFAEGKDKEIREMLLISDKFILGKYATVKKAECTDLFEDGLATLTNGQQKMISKTLPKTTIKNGKTIKQIELPKLGKSMSQFANEVADVMKETNTLFYRINQKEIVEVGRIKDHKTGEELYTGFMAVEANRFITTTEEHMVLGQNIHNDGEVYFRAKSMKRETAHTILKSKILQEALPQIDRIFTIPIPIMDKGKLTFPKKGYDKRFGSWLLPEAPEINKPEMTLEEAKKIFEDIYKEFCFETTQDKHNAIAALLTPYLRGLFTKFNVRTPIFFYMANRERAGKDYCAGITGLVYEDNTIEETPVSTNENRNNNVNDELRKKILSAMITGRKRMHFSNNKGLINNSELERIITSTTHTDRILGRNQILTFDNEIDYSLSGNASLGFTADLAARGVSIRFFLDIEDANLRKFEKPNLHEWVRTNRCEIISALYCLVRNWVGKGSPAGTMLFASYPEWAKMCGGIMEAAGYNNPCTFDKNLLDIGGDRDTADMKTLFELGYEQHPEKWIPKKTIIDLIKDNDEIFGYFDLDKRGDATKMGIKIMRFIGRVLSDIRLVVEDRKVVKKSDWRFKFTKTQKKEEKDENDGFQTNLKGNETVEQAEKEHINENENVEKNGEKGDFGIGEVG